MRIFKVKLDANHVQIVQPADHAKITLDRFNFDCEPKKDQWDDILFYVYNPKIKPKNFYGMGLGNLVFDEAALDVCRTVFEMSGEILVVRMERSAQLYALNILECMNGLNYGMTEWDHYKDGTKGRILKYAFHPERVLNESSIFKIPETSKTEIFCWADVKAPEDEFYHIYHEHHLTGLIFEELYNSKSN